MNFLRLFFVDAHLFQANWFSNSFFLGGKMNFLFFPKKMNFELLVTRVTSFIWWHEKSSFVVFVVYSQPVRHSCITLAVLTKPQCSPTASDHHLVHWERRNARKGMGKEVRGTKGPGNLENKCTQAHTSTHKHTHIMHITRLWRIHAV